MKFEWTHVNTEFFNDSENTYSDTWRAPVKGGWLVRVVSQNGMQVTFVPDEYHSWKVEVDE